MKKEINTSLNKYKSVILKYFHVKIAPLRLFPETWTLAPRLKQRPESELLLW